MLPVMLKAGHTPGGSVFEDPRWLKRGGRVDYRNVCPVAKDLYAREITIHLDQWLSPADCDAIAKGINKVLAAYGTPDPKGKHW